MLSFLPALIALLIQGSPEPSSSQVATWLLRAPGLEQQRARMGSAASADARQAALQCLLKTGCGEAMLTAYGPLLQELFQAALNEARAAMIAGSEHESPPADPALRWEECVARPALGYREISRPRDGPAL